MDMKKFKELKKVLDDSCQQENLGQYAEEGTYTEIDYENIAEWIDENYKEKKSESEN